MKVALAPLVLTVGVLLHAQAPTVESRARDIVSALVARNFTAIEAQYSSEMKAVLPPGGLAASWDAAAAQFGAFESVLEVHVQPAGANQLALVSCRFAQYDVTLRIAFNAAGELSALASTSPISRAVWTAPDYIDASAFEERPMTVRSGRWELPGILTVPKTAGPHPAVVLVHGSGPNDMDESIGPNRMFKDLAGGLASRGIVVLRYDKRTHKYSTGSTDSPTTFTVKDEVMDDADAAVALVGTMPEVDRARIFVAGHSEGGYLAPRIATDNASIKGLILLAGNVRPLEDLIVDQVRHQASLAGPVTPQIQQALDAAEAARQEITNPNLKLGMTVRVLTSTLPASYLLDLRTYHPDATAAALTIPMLILQGERDYQVTLADLALWRAALASHANVTLRSYPALNHFFFAGTGPGTPAEYMRLTHVDRAVITDIAAWCTAR
jgi:dienelactone hydrolase